MKSPLIAASAPRVSPITLVRAYDPISPPAVAMSIVGGLDGSIVSTRRIHGPAGSVIFVSVNPGARVCVDEVLATRGVAVAWVTPEEATVASVAPVVRAIAQAVARIPRMD